MSEIIACTLEEALAQPRKFTIIVTRNMLERIEKQLSERDAELARCVDEAYERAAQVCDLAAKLVWETGAGVGYGSLNNAAHSIRALKTNPSPSTDESPDK